MIHSHYGSLSPKEYEAQSLESLKENTAKVDDKIVVNEKEYR